MVRSLPRPLLAVVIALPVALALAAVVLAITLGADAERPVPPADDAATPLAVAAVPAPQASSPDCARLLGALPDALRSGPRQLDRRPLADPAPAGTAAWGPTEDPAVLRCGLDRPAELTSTASLLEVNGVRWLHLPDPDLPRATWVAVDRAVHVALTLSEATGTGPLQDVSTAIGATLPAREIRPAG
ncbi:MAG TPA: DUF3515 domain-containing protein [Pseudonocardiaceae bacterium]